MTKKIDEIQLIKDFDRGESYSEMAFKHKCSKPLVVYRLKKLGLGKYKEFKEKISIEKKDFIKSLMDTFRGRKQLLDILRGE